MIQNHALQLLTMVAMEPPSRNDRRRDPRREAEGAALAQAVHAPRASARDVVRGQYRAGSVDGKAVPGYLEEDKVPPASAHRDLRRAAHRGAELALGRRAVLPAHRQAPRRARRADRRQLPARRRTRIFPGSNPPNKLVIKLQPEDGLELHLLAAKGAGQAEALAPVSLDLDFDKAFAAEPRRRLRAAAARRHRRPAQPVRAQRRAGGGVALGRADPRGVAPRRRARRAPTRPARGARRRRARWWRATASPGRKSSSRRDSG